MEGAVDNGKQWDEWLQHLEFLQKNNGIEDGWISVKVTITFYVPSVFEKRWEVLFWGPSLSPPSLLMFRLISWLLLLLAF